MQPALSPEATAATSAVNALTKVESSRAEGFGGAAAALGQDATVSWLNPAAPAQLGSASLTLAGQRGQFDEAAGQALASLPVSDGSLVLGLVYYDAGTLELDALDGSSYSLKVQQDLLGILGYSHAISDRLAAGIALKSLHSEILGERASAFAFDAGLQAHLTAFLKGGVSIQNFGSQLKYLEDSVSLPALMRLGVAAGGWLGDLGVPTLTERDVLLLVADLEYPFAERLASIRGGIEFQTCGMIALRAGARLRSRDQAQAFAAGLGIKSGPYRLDYSAQLGGEFRSPQSLSFTLSLPSLVN